MGGTTRQSQIMVQADAKYVPLTVALQFLRQADGVALACEFIVIRSNQSHTA